MNTFIVDGLTKKSHLKMTYPDSYNYSALKINLDTYNKILKSSIRLQKNYTMKPASVSIKIILNKFGN